MSIILIGSHALSFRDHSARQNYGDTDIVCSYDDLSEYKKAWYIKVNYPINSGKSIFMRNVHGNIHEAEIAWPASRAEKLIEFVESQLDNMVIFENIIVPSLDVLYMLKMSHRYMKDSPHFKKTLDDILFMRSIGAKIRPEQEEFYQQRMKDTYTNKLPVLMQSKEGFFGADTGVEYMYDHDTIHEAVKHLDQPAYTYFQDGAVWCSKALWDACSYQVQMYAAYEEITVLALERSLIPYPGKKTSKEAFDMAQMKLSTSISSGWFREFVWENYYQIQAMYSDDFVTKFEQGLAAGIVKPHKEK